MFFSFLCNTRRPEGKHNEEAYCKGAEASHGTLLWMESWRLQLRGCTNRNKSESRQILVPYRQVPRHATSAERRAFEAGALAIGGFGRSRWRGGRGKLWVLLGCFEVCSSTWPVVRGVSVVGGSIRSDW